MNNNIDINDKIYFYQNQNDIKIIKNFLSEDIYCINCHSLKEISSSNVLKKLVISDSPIKYLNSYNNLTVLKLNNISIKNLPFLPSLYNLTMIYCNKIKNVPLFSKIMYIYVENCLSLENVILPSKLNTITFKNCPLLNNITGNTNEVRSIFINNCSVKKLEFMYNLKKLIFFDCSNCVNLEDINICDNTNFINISGTKKINLSPYLNLETLCCIDSSITYIPKINKLRILRCSGCNIKKIPLLPNLVKLECNNCIKLEKISPGNKLLTVYCNNCPKLNFDCLLQSKNLSTLKCNDNNIKYIPKIPLLSNLEVNNCKNLLAIKDFKNLNILNICNCPNLSEISGLSNIITIICNYNSSLKELSSLPTLMSLRCENCIYLERIYNMEKLSCLFCNNCINLKEVYGVPLISNFQRNHCDDLTIFPSYRFYDDNVIYRLRYEKWCLEKSKERCNIILKELIEKSCHPKRIQSYLDIEELKWLGIYNEDISKYF